MDPGECAGRRGAGRRDVGDGAAGGARIAKPRFEQELAKARAEIERASRKLADARFVERAPAHLVQEERDKLERFEREADELRERLAALGA
jgi:valyl-tRNA synthetase